MTINDLSTGHDWILWATAFAILSAILLSGHGANLLAGYNTMSRENREKYNETKLCRLTGAGMLAAAIATLIIVLGITVLPAWVINCYQGFLLSDCLAMMIPARTI